MRRILTSQKRPRMDREEKTLFAMVKIYCSLKHGTKDTLCFSCDELMKYAKTRLVKCHSQEAKTTCAKCPVHCYKPAMRDKVKDVMRFSGPRMTYRHPILAFLHFVDKFKY